MLRDSEIDEEKQKEIIEKIKDITDKFNIGRTLATQKNKENIDNLKKALNEETIKNYFTDEEIQFLTQVRRIGRKATKQATIEQKEKGELGENKNIDAELNEEYSIIERREQIETEDEVR